MVLLSFSSFSFSWGVQKRFFFGKGTFLGRAFSEDCCALFGGALGRAQKQYAFWVDSFARGHESERLMFLAESVDALLLSGKKRLPK